ncbi:MAG: peptidylprolyl isomerase [Halofilum sp. (in: g-proteobacteria)]
MPLRQHCLAGLLCLLAALAPAASFGANASAQTLDRIAAVVNEGVILASELDAEIAQVRQRLRSEDRNLPDPQVLRERVLDELILQELQMQQARQRGIEIADAEVNEALRNMASDNDTDLAGLRAAFRRQGGSVEQLRADVREQLTISRLRQRTVGSGVEVSNQEIDDYLDRAERSSDQRREVRVRHILVGLPSDASTAEVADARERAQAAVGQLQDDADFADVASRISDGPQALSGGDLGWRQLSQLPELFADALGDAGLGDVVGPLRSPNGFHVLQLTDQRGGDGASQTVTQARVRHILLRGNETSGDDEGEGESQEDAARERLSELRQRLQSGADFTNLAQAHSEDDSSAPEGGELGWIGPGDLPTVVHEVIHSLPTGELSEPFQSPMGWHLVEVLERREQEGDAEQQRRTEARQALYQRKLQEESQRWLQQLRDGAYVETRLEQ